MAAITPLLAQSRVAFHYPFWGSAGRYTPAIISGKPTMEHAPPTSVSLPETTIHGQFSFSPRHGIAAVTHSWLHELAHFAQDAYGLLLTPAYITSPAAPPIQLDARSTVSILLFCETMAQTEAIRASWQLQKQGYPQAWKGATRSLDWAPLAKDYASAIATGTDEQEAAKQCFYGWYQRPARQYYETKAIAAFGHQLEGFSKDAIQPQLRATTASALLQRLPEILRPDYLDDLSELDQPPYTGCAAPKAQARLSSLEKKNGTAQSDAINEILIGSATYWSLAAVSSASSKPSISSTT